MWSEAERKAMETSVARRCSVVCDRLVVVELDKPWPKDKGCKDGPKVGPRCFTCRHCGCRMAELENMNQHLMTHAGDETNATWVVSKRLETKTFRCPTCLKMYSTKSILSNHISLVHKGKGCKCHLCGRRVVNWPNLKLHMDGFHKQARFDCLQCGRVCHLRATLISHVRKCHGDSPKFDCPKCSKRYSGLEGLRNHIGSSHENVRFECGHCGKKYKRKCWLVDHIKAVHTGNRLQCPLCPKSLTTRTGVKMHVVSVHEGVKFKCRVCQDEFHNGSNLRRHVLSVHKGEDLDCSLCGRNYKSTSSLRSHMKTAHEGKKNVRTTE